MHNLYVTVHLSDTIQHIQVDEIIAKLKADNQEVVPGWNMCAQYYACYKLSYWFRNEHEQARKILRRLQRGKPIFKASCWSEAELMGQVAAAARGVGEYDERGWEPVR